MKLTSHIAYLAAFSVILIFTLALPVYSIDTSSVAKLNGKESQELPVKRLDRRGFISRLLNRPRTKYNQMIEQLVERIRNPLTNQIFNSVNDFSIKLSNQLPSALQGILTTTLVASPGSASATTPVAPTPKSVPQKPAVQPNTPAVPPVQGFRRLWSRGVSSMPGAWPESPVDSSPIPDTTVPSSADSAGKPPKINAQPNTSNAPQIKPSDSSAAGSVLSSKQRIYNTLNGVLGKIINPVVSRWLEEVKTFVTKHVSTNILIRLKQRLSWKTSSKAPEAVVVSGLDNSQDGRALEAVKTELNGQTPATQPPNQHRMRRADTQLPGAANGSATSQTQAKSSRIRSILGGIANRSLSKVCLWIKPDVNAITEGVIRSALEDMYAALYNSIIGAIKTITTCLQLPEIQFVRKLASNVVETGTAAIMWPGEKLAEWRRRQLGATISPVVLQSVKQDMANVPDTCSSIAMQMNQHKQDILAKIHNIVDPVVPSLIKVVQHITNTNVCKTFATQINTVIPVFPEKLPA